MQAVHSGVDESERSRRIFISYRRGDSADVAGRVFDGLVHEFGRMVFMDQDWDSIPGGSVGEARLREEVGRCEVLSR